MNDSHRCPACHAEIPAEAPEGLCPRCLLQAGLASQPSQPAPGQPLATAPFSDHGFVPPTPEALAPFFPQLEILELLGRGGMGAVYKARQPGLDRLVALKILPPSVAVDPAFAERFTREARALARLNHPNIVAVYDFGQAKGDGHESADPLPITPRLFYFLMEFVDGVNLRQALHQGHLEPAQALKIVPQICDALQFAHDEGIVHRDIKPENILLDKRGRVKIADFGLAKLLGVKTNYALTGTRQVMGTPHYMAPEQIQGTRDVDHRADIYSLGVTFYEMLTGELPLGRFAPPSKKVQIDVRLDEVVLRALEVEPEQRYQHASEVKTEVELIASTPESVKVSERQPVSERKVALEQTILDLLPEEKVAAVRVYREATGAGVAEAMSAVKAIAEKHGKNKPMAITAELIVWTVAGAIACLFLGIWLAEVSYDSASRLMFRLGGIAGAIFWIGAMLSQHRRRLRWRLEDLEAELENYAQSKVKLIASTSESVRAPEVQPASDRKGALEQTIIDLLPEEKVAAVRIYREATGAGVAEAMSAVKAIAEKHGKNQVPFSVESFLWCLPWAIISIFFGWFLREYEPRGGTRMAFMGGGILLAVFLIGRNITWQRSRSRWRLEDFEEDEEQTKEEPPTPKQKTKDAERTPARVRKAAEGLLLWAAVTLLTGLAVFGWAFFVAMNDRDIQRAPAWMQQSHAVLLELFLTSFLNLLCGVFIGAAGVLLRSLRWRLLTLIVIVLFGLCVPLALAFLGYYYFLEHLQEAQFLPSTWPALIPLLLGMPLAGWAAWLLFREDVRQLFQSQPPVPMARKLRIAKWFLGLMFVGCAIVSCLHETSGGHDGGVTTYDRRVIGYLYDPWLWITGLGTEEEQWEIRWASWGMAILVLGLSSLFGFVWVRRAQQHLGGTEWTPRRVIKWLIVGLAAALAGVVLASLLSSSKTGRHQEQATRHPSVDLHHAEKDANRRAAEWILTIAAKVKIADGPGGQEREIDEIDKLPVEKFRLVNINLNGNPRVTDDGLKNLQGLRHLRWLSLGNTKITNAGLHHLRDLPNLRYLDISVTAVSDAGLEALKELTELDNVNLYKTQVTDAGLTHLKGLPKLAFLFLGHTQVTDKGLQHLEGLTNLSELHLENTNVTAAGVAKLKAALPKCKVILK